MKPIRITEKNKVAIVAALAAVNGKATAHAWTTYADIEYLSMVAEKQVIDLLGSQKAAVGAKLQATSGGKVANAYKYSRSGTWVRIERRSTGWFLVSVDHATLYSSGGSRQLTLTAEQDRRAIEVLRAKYTVEVTE
jgi:hypothetical protein